MAGRRNKRGQRAFFWLLVAVVLLTLLGWLFNQFVIQYDFEGYTSGELPLRDFLPEDGYTRVPYPPYNPDATSEPTPRPTPVPTPVPMDKYAMLNKRLLVPETSLETVHAGLSECRISESDDDRVLVVRGWGYIEGLNANKSDVYLVVSTRYGDNHRVYMTTRESGSSGQLHDPASGINLDQADFSAAIRIEATYADGEYRLGVLVVNHEQRETRAYTKLDARYNFSVKSGKITGFTY